MERAPYRTPFRAVLLLLVLGLGAGCAAADEDAAEVHVRVPAGAPFTAVADSLEARGVIRSALLFRLYARLSGADRAAKAGTYAFRPGAGWRSILDDLRHGRVATIRLTVPEAWTAQRIAERLVAATGLEADAVDAVIQESGAAARFGVPGPTLEGYLYPATYEFPVDVTAETAIATMIERYRSVWTPERRALADSLGLSEREVVTLASIIEAEARLTEELPLISAVFHNRLRIGYPLQADATVQYALGERQARLFYGHIDRVADNPYNTYRHRGLPPGPIASPGVRAIDAALRPAEADYLYFVARPDGSHIFTRSLAEHNQARVRARREWEALQERRQQEDQSERAPLEGNRP